MRALFDRMVTEHQGRVFRICVSILADDHLGADAAQDVFVRLWRQLGRGAAPRNTRAWLGRVAVSASLDIARWRQVRDVAHARLHAPPRSVEPEEAARTRELRAALDAAVARLPEGQRTVFLLRHDAELSLAEVAETLSVSLSTVKTQFARACLKLQAQLRAYRPPEGPKS